MTVLRHIADIILRDDPKNVAPPGTEFQMAPIRPTGCEHRNCRAAGVGCESYSLGAARRLSSAGTVATDGASNTAAATRCPPDTECPPVRRDGRAGRQSRS